MALPQYPNWRVLEIGPGPMMAAILALMPAGTTALQFRDILIRIGSRIIPDNPLPCEALHFQQVPNINFFYPALLMVRGHEYMSRHYVAMDTVLGVPVGYMNILLPPGDLNDAVFSHPAVEDVMALATYIVWACSFTMSPALPRAGQQSIRNYYAGQAQHFTLRLAKFMHNRIAEQLLGLLGRPEVEHVFFYSVGAEEARAQHRKNGKRNTCTFVNEWTRPDGRTITGLYNQPVAHNTMFYLSMPGGGDFIGSPLYAALHIDGSDFSIAGPLPPGHPNYFADENWVCRIPVENNDEEMAGGGSRKRHTMRKKLTRRRLPRKCTQRK